MFANEEINITTEGRPLLGAAIGSDSYISDFVSKMVGCWVEQVESPAVIAESSATCCLCLPNTWPVKQMVLRICAEPPLVLVISCNHSRMVGNEADPKIDWKRSTK